MADRWVLAFDSSCATCRQVSSAVAHACAGRLETLPLASDEVQQWRRTAAQTALGPTLIRLDATGVRCWTGRAMAVPLTRRLGVRASARVVSALGELRSSNADLKTDRESATPKIGRKQFLRFAAGIATAGLILRGQTPVFAADVQHAQEDKDAKAWADSNAGKLPQTYDALASLPAARQRVVWHSSAPNIKGQLWVEHFARYRAQHPKLSAAQVKVLNMGTMLATRESTFAPNAHDNPFTASQIKDLETAARQAFGEKDAHALVVNLGSFSSAAFKGRAPTPMMVRPDNFTCTCSTQSDWCSSNSWPSNFCQGSKCYCGQYHGCGTMMWYNCNGACIMDSC